MTGKGVMVYSEDKKLGLQLLGKGREIADELNVELFAVLISASVTEARVLIEHGADKVYMVENPALAQFAVEPYKTIIIELVKMAAPEFILIGATKRGKELAPRVAAALDTGCMTDCINVYVDNERRLIADRITYGGSTISKEASRKIPHLATIPPQTFEKSLPSNRDGEILKLEKYLPEPKVVVLERRKKSRSDIGLENAPIIISAGRGFKQKEDLRFLEELAKVLGAKIGCTRPIAADNGWLEEWIGISGRKVTPHLYLACGISGTIQHAAGIREAKIIISINSDEAANIFELSDYNVIGDLYKILPALTKILKEKKK